MMYFDAQNLLFGLPYVHSNSSATAATTTQFQLVKCLTSFYIASLLSLIAEKEDGPLSPNLGTYRA